MLVSLTVGKVDAGVAVLLTEDKRIIEFPSVLLPPDIHSGSIVDVNVSRNLTSENAQQKHFTSLQSQIFQTFGLQSPSPPNLRCRNATQTSVVLEWDPIELATAELRTLSLYRNGAKAGNIPRPLDMHSTKISGLAVDTEYNFQLMLKTSAGSYSSERLVVRTHKMTELSGITVTPGVMPAALRESLAHTLAGFGGKLIDSVRIDTTHFVCTEGRGQAWEKAVEMNIPVVVPDWVKGCEREGRIVGVRGYYLNADPKLRQVGPNPAFNQQQQLQQQQQQHHATSPSPMSTPRTEITPPTPDRPTHDRRDFRRRDDDDDDDDDDRPAPPPKYQNVGSPSQASDDRTLAEDGRSSTKSKVEKDEEDEDEDEDEDGEDDNSTPNASPRPDQHGSHSELPSRPKASVEDAGEDDSSFQDVAL